MSLSTDSNTTNVVDNADVEVDLAIDPGRVSFGLSRIGYTPTTAVCDVLDNSVRAGAKNINIRVIKERPNLSDKKKDNVKEYLVIDDGSGMDDAGIRNALTLGSPDNYEEHSLSKFGLGLKSAAFSQGEELEVISSPGVGAPFVKYIFPFLRYAQKESTSPNAQS